MAFRVLKAACWVGLVFGYATLIVGCSYIYYAFYNASLKHYEKQTVENNFIFQNNGTRIENNDTYQPNIVVICCSALAVIAGLGQIINSTMMLLSQKEKLSKRIGHCVVANILVMFALMTSLFVLLAKDHEITDEHPTGELNKHKLEFLLTNRNYFVNTLGLDISVLFLSIMYLSICFQNMNADTLILLR